MTFYYSASTGGLYNTGFADYVLPGDAVEITDADHADLMTGQAEGKRIIADGDGAPVLADPAPPSLPQQARALIAAGLTIESTSTPAIDGIYRTDAQAQQILTSVATRIATGHGFPGGGSTFVLTLADGSGVTFPSTAVFLDVALAITDFVYAALQVVEGRSTDLPDDAVVIA